MEEKVSKPKSPTLRQRRAAEALAKNALSDNPLPTGQVLESVGYGTITQDPSRITNSIGFKQALRDLGLTEELVTTALVEDIKAKPKARVKELGLAADILQMRKREEEPTTTNTKGNTYNFFFNAEVKEKVREMEDSIKSLLIKKRESN